MNVIFCIVRNIVIDDHLNIIDVDSARHNIGSYENIILSALELEHHIIALSLFQVAVHGSAVYSNLLEEAASCFTLNLLPLKTMTRFRSPALKMSLMMVIFWVS